MGNKVCVAMHRRSASHFNVLDCLAKGMMKMCTYESIYVHLHWIYISHLFLSVTMQGKGKKRRASTSATDLAQMTQEDEDDELMVLNDDDNNVMEMMEAQDAGKGTSYILVTFSVFLSVNENKLNLRGAAKGPTKFLKQQDDDEEETEQKPAEASKENKVG